MFLFVRCRWYVARISFVSVEDSRGHPIERENLLALVKALPSKMHTPPIARLNAISGHEFSMMLYPIEDDVRVEEVYLAVSDILQGRGVVDVIKFEENLVEQKRGAKVCCLLRVHETIQLQSNKQYLFDKRTTPFQIALFERGKAPSIIAK